LKPRYSTKSVFKLAVECPTKLFYRGKKGCRDLKQEGSFLRALADGDFQVGEFVKSIIPCGIFFGLDLNALISQDVFLLKKVGIAHNLSYTFFIIALST